jgi:hypothetical protein
MTPQQVLNDAMTVRQILLIRVANGQQFEAFAEITQLADELRKVIQGFKPLNEMGKIKLNQTIKKINSKIKLQAPDLSLIPKLEVQFMKQVADEVQDESTIIPPAILTSATAVVISGATVGDRIKNIERNLIFNIEAVVKDGASQGLSNKQIADSLIGKLSTGQKGTEPLKRAVRDYSTEIRTSVMSLASQARQDFVESNPNVFNAAMHSSVLDSRTTDICRERNGKSWRLPDYTPIGHVLPFRLTPLHRNCRSLIVYSLVNTPRSFSNKTTFDDFLARQDESLLKNLFGARNLSAYRNGRITTSQLVDNKNNTLSIDGLI